ncbi:general substrate transporter [Xylariomycetidae sp. FL0641]|nr:general substrate transporter [Xylariomycetidae sp. FL0641]
MGFMDVIRSKTRYFNRRLALACSLIALSTFNYGFDNQAFATTQAMDAFDKQFGEYDADEGTWVLPPYWLSLFNSLNYIGFAGGVIIGSWVSAHYGRRMCMFLMSVYALVTATIAVTSNNKSQIMAARVLNYVYVGMELSVVPAFQSEIVPAAVRGLVVGTYQFSLILGGLVINCVCLGTARLPDNRAWRIPVGLFYVVPAAVAALVWLVPESPRWLLAQGREAEARANLAMLRAGACFDDAQVDAEFAEVRYALAQERELRGAFWEVFGRGHRQRTALVVGINAAQQATGQQFASQYGTVYAKSLGTVDPFVFSIVVALINALAIALALATNDRVGRRGPLLASAVVMCVSLVAMGGLGTPAVLTTGLKIAIVSMLALMTFGFSIGLAPLTYVVATEIPALRLRDATLRLGFFVNVLFNFLSNFSLPYLLYAPYGNLGSKTGFVFGSIAALAVVFIWFCVPECKGKSLEQIDRMFRDGVPLRRFGDFDASGFAAEAVAADALGKKGDGNVRVEEETIEGDRGRREPV